MIDQLSGGRAGRHLVRLVRPPAPGADAPPLDDDQRRVVEHAGSPLLVLAGPGTGKTTTLVESVVRRIERGTPPDRILVLTFSRRAAAELRRRITARLGRSIITPRAMTFHAFCYALVRRFSDPELYGTGIRLLTAPEQDFRLRETLRWSERVHWPDGFEAARETRGFAAEIRAVLARARQLGMDPHDLVFAGEQAGRAVWSAAGEFFEEYLDVLDAEEVLDYAELVHRSRILLADPAVADTLRGEIDSVLVDEYQDTDPAQARLLQAVTGRHGDVVVFGDPDQSIYAFRGAQARGLVEFPTAFTLPDGSPAPVLALGHTRRFGKEIAAATRAVVGRLPVPAGLPADVVQRYRRPETDPGAPRGRVEAYTFDSTGAEAEHIADLLRQAHLHDGLAWSDMAVLVRSGRASLPALGRALTAAGVPVEVAGDEIPLSAELAVRPLLLALQVAQRDVRLDADEAVRLLTSPLCGLDGMGVRRLGRALRDAERAELAGGDLPRPSPELIRRALESPDLLDACPVTDEVERARELAALLRRAAAAIGAGDNAEEVLWLLWSQTSWPERLRAEATTGSDAAGRANRDLDAVCALFDIAARSNEVVGRRGAAAFLAEVEGQQIPADTQREADLRGGAVRLLTAHRSKGLEWSLVVVASVQEGGWPDLRRRGTVLEADRLGRHGLSEPDPPGVRLAEERRLFYVACTRARQRLVVTAVNGTEGEGDQPSRFLDELAVRVQPVRGRPRRPLSLTALVGELRRVAADPSATPRLREEAGTRLARLAEARDDRGRLLVPAADPSRWWGMREITGAPAPVVADQIQMSGSQLGSLLSCPRNWFLSRKAHGDQGRGSAASVGSVVHALVEHAEPDTDPDELSAQLDRVWEQIDFDATWLSGVERAEAESALERFYAWQAANPREVLGREVTFAIDVTAGEHEIRLTGTVDRLERDSTGLRIVDFKTGRSKPTAAEVAGSDQLGLYQLAASLGAFDALAPGERRVSGAELVYLRHQDGQLPYPRVFGQDSIDVTGDQWVRDHLAEAATLLREERFEARVNDGCRYCPFAVSCPAQRAGEQVVS